MTKIGFIGLGIMGRPMAGHLQAGGHELYVVKHRADLIYDINPNDRDSDPIFWRCQVLTYEDKKGRVVDVQEPYGCSMPLDDQKKHRILEALHSALNSKKRLPTFRQACKNDDELIARYSRQGLWRVQLGLTEPLVGGEEGDGDLSAIFG